MIHILLVDDDPDILDILRIELEENPGWEIDTVTSAIDALEMIQKKRYDVIVTDYIMPRMNGGDFLAAIRRKEYPAYIVLYSGRLDEPHESFMKELGADAILHRRGDPEIEFSALKGYIASYERQVNCTKEQEK